MRRPFDPVLPKEKEHYHLSIAPSQGFCASWWKSLLAKPQKVLESSWWGFVIRGIPIRRDESKLMEGIPSWMGVVGANHESFLAGHEKILLRVNRWNEIGGRTEAGSATIVAKWWWLVVHVGWCWSILINVVIGSCWLMILTKNDLSLVMILVIWLAMFSSHDFIMPFIITHHYCWPLSWPFRTTISEPRKKKNTKYHTITKQ